MYTYRLLVRRNRLDTLIKSQYILNLDWTAAWINARKLSAICNMIQNDTARRKRKREREMQSLMCTEKRPRGGLVVSLVYLYIFY